jgi:hypothetical protein
MKIPAIYSFLFALCIVLTACEDKGPDTTPSKNLSDANKRIQQLEGEVADLKRQLAASRTKPPPSVAATSSPRTVVASAKQEVSLSQNALFIEYYANKAAFYRKYEGVSVRLQSEVLEINADFIRIRKDSNWLDCFFDAAAAPAFETLKVGQPVGIVCFVSKRNEPFGLQMQSCRIP